MLFDSIVNVLLSPVKLILNTIPVIDVAIPDGVMAMIFEIFKIAGYFLPIKTISIVLGLKLMMYMARITIALVVRAKSVIPTMGA